MSFQKEIYRMSSDFVSLFQAITLEIISSQRFDMD